MVKEISVVPRILLLEEGRLKNQGTIMANLSVVLEKNIRINK